MTEGELPESFGCLHLFSDVALQRTWRGDMLIAVPDNLFLKIIKCVTRSFGLLDNLLGYFPI